MSLADPNDDILVLADGTRIVKASGTVVRDKKPSRFVEVPAGSDAQAIVAKTRRSIAEMPLPINQMNILSVCLTYTLYGLSDAEIAVAAKLTVDQVKNIKKLSEYKDLSNNILQSILEHEAEDVRSFFKQKARTAAEKIIDLAESDNDVLAFKASQDVLDRAGFRPADVVEHKHTMENALQIEYVRRADPKDIPVIDLAPEEFNADRS